MSKLLLLLTFFASVAVTAAAEAQFISQRFLPPAGERGRLGPAQDLPGVTIGNRVFRMTPGARIYDQHNRTIVHGQLVPGSEILFLRDQAGNVQRIYILTDQELQQLRQAGRR